MRRFLRVLRRVPVDRRGAAIGLGAIVVALLVEASSVLAGASPLSRYSHAIPAPRAPVLVGRTPKVVVGHSVKNDVSPALRTLRPVPSAPRPEREANDNPLLASRHHNAADPVVQHTLAKPNMPSP